MHSELQHPLNCPELYHKVYVALSWSTTYRDTTAHPTQNAVESRVESPSLQRLPAFYNATRPILPYRPPAMDRVNNLGILGGSGGTTSIVSGGDLVRCCCRVKWKNSLASGSVALETKSGRGHAGEEILWDRVSAKWSNATKERLMSACI